MDLFQVDVTDAGDLMFRGELDAASAALVGELTARHERDPLVVDLSELTFLDAAGVGAITSLATERPDRPVILRRPQPNVARVLDILAATRPENLSVQREPVFVRGDGPGAWSRFAASVQVTRSVAEANARARARLDGALARMVELRGRLRDTLATARRTRGARWVRPGSW
jgi:anti-anti-sigma factor